MSYIQNSSSLSASTLLSPSSSLPSPSPSSPSSMCGFTDEQWIVTFVEYAISELKRYTHYISATVELDEVKTNLMSYTRSLYETAATFVGTNNIEKRNDVIRAYVALTTQCNYKISSINLSLGDCVNRMRFVKYLLAEDVFDASDSERRRLCRTSDFAHEDEEDEEKLTDNVFSYCSSFGIGAMLLRVKENNSYINRYKNLQRHETASVLVFDKANIKLSDVFSLSLSKFSYIMPQYANSTVIDAATTMQYNKVLGNEFEFSVTSSKLPLFVLPVEVYGIIDGFVRTYYEVQDTTLDELLKLTSSSLKPITKARKGERYVLREDVFVRALDKLSSKDDNTVLNAHYESRRRRNISAKYVYDDVFVQCPKDKVAKLKIKAKRSFECNVSLDDFNVRLNDNDTTINNDSLADLRKFRKRSYLIYAFNYVYKNTTLIRLALRLSSENLLKLPHNIVTVTDEAPMVLYADNLSAICFEYAILNIECEDVDCTLSEFHDVASMLISYWIFQFRQYRSVLDYNIRVENNPIFDEYVQTLDVDIDIVEKFKDLRYVSTNDRHDNDADATPTATCVDVGFIATDKDHVNLANFTEMRYLMNTLMFNHPENVNISSPESMMSKKITH
ncbi:hypothetical protein HT594_00044 [Phenacoccus solenopsis nudivirus]|nr:hypothetical protein HT594_00044 [Phenacoccus solenopsis nudivirus]